jgi:hypothetical protein
MKGTHVMKFLKKNSLRMANKGGSLEARTLVGGGGSSSSRLLSLRAAGF